MVTDLNAACRGLMKSPWFTAITVLTLALGIGASTAIFGVVNHLILNLLPYPDSDRLVYLDLWNPSGQFVVATPESVASTWRVQARSLDGVEAYSFRDLVARDESGSRVLSGIGITPGLPALLGITPLLGRSLTPADAAEGAPPVVMLSYGAWRQEYGGADDVVGRALTLDDVSHVVVGVFPPRWDAFLAAERRPDFWLPLSLDPTASSPTDFQILEVFARMRAGFSVDAVTAELDDLVETALAAGPGNGRVSTQLRRPSDRISESTRDSLTVLLMAVGLVMLVACSNVANLLLARGASRIRQLALRSALGASTWRLIRALFAECLVLALAGAAVGIAFAWLALRVLMRFRPDGLRDLSDVQLDSTVLAFTLCVSVATALLFGIAPAVQLAPRKLANALRHGGSGVVRRATGARLRSVLVAMQMALSVVLLVGAGLLIRSVVHLQHVEIGFDIDNLFSAQLSLPSTRYQAPASRDALSDVLLERIRSSPGVSAATHATFPPPFFFPMPGVIEIRGMTLSDADARARRGHNFVRPDYFATLGIRLVEGRAFTVDDLRDGNSVIINRAAAQHSWPKGDALGAELKWGSTWLSVVGIVDNVVSGGLVQSRNVPQYYLPHQTAREPLMADGPPIMTLIMRSEGDPAVAIGSLRAAIRELDPAIAIRNVVLTETALARSIEAPRFNMALLAAFAVVALLLAAVGLASLISYEVSERTHEFGVRMALGARAGRIRRLAMRDGLTPAFVGLMVGVIGALGATRLLTSLLYGVAPRDPLTHIAVIALLALVAVGASWLPARRATQVDPAVALRAD